MKLTAATSVLHDGFRGSFYRTEPADRCMLVLMGDEGNDFLSRTCAGWLLKEQNCSALCLAVRQRENDDTGLHSWPLEYIENAVCWLHKQNIRKIGIMGISMQASLALSAAARMEDFSLVIAFSPNDFVPWGFYQGKIAGSSHGEWPSGTSAFSWRGKDLAFQPAGLSKEEYWALFCKEKKKYREMHAITVFEQSEEKQPVTEACKIPVEKIRGRLVLISARDDVMWDSAKYIRRIKCRLMETDFPYPVETYLYPYGTHLLLPGRMLRRGLLFASGLVSRLFASGRRHPAACAQARQDLDEKMTAVFRSW